MRTRLYVRIAKRAGTAKPKVAVSTTAREGALTDSVGKDLPTVAFALDVELPDKLFRQAEPVIATLSVPESATTVQAVCAEHLAEYLADSCLVWGARP